MTKAAETGGNADSVLLDALARTVGAKGLVTDPDEMEPHLVEWRGRYRGAALALVKPSTTEEVAAVMRLAAEAGIPIVP